MKVSEKLKELRLESNKTQQEVAKELNVLVESYRRWENGRSNPKKDSLEKLAKVFNVSVGYLLGETKLRSSTKINEIMEKLSDHRQEKTINYAENQLIEQEQENKVISIHQSTFSYNVLEEVALSAGLGESYFDSLDTTTVYWNKYVKHDVAIFIRGNSMEPDYEYGQVALINYQNHIDCDGGIYAVDDASRGVAYIKSVYVEDDYLRLVSLNEDIDFAGNRLFPDILLPRDENTKIVGKVIEAFTPIEKNF